MFLITRKIVLLFFLLFLLPNLFAEETVDALVQANCLGCHSDPNLNAPNLQAMSWSTKQELMFVMNIGKMKSQSSHLSEVQRELIAEYISKSVEDDQIKKCKFNLEPQDVLGRNHWSSWGVNKTNSRNQPSSNIDSSNVHKLKLRWAFNVSGYESRSPPVVIGNLLIVGTARGFVYALSRATGCSHWSYRAEGKLRNSPLVNLDDSTLYVVDEGLIVHSLNLLDGTLLWKSSIRKEEFSIATGSPVLHDSRLIIPISTIETAVALLPFHECCKSSGAIVALDTKTGEILWEHRVLKEAKLVGKRLISRVKKFAPAGASVWGTPAIDESGKKVFFGTAQSTQSPASEFSDAIIALDINDGKRIWSNQTTSKDAHNVACEIPLHPGCPEEDGPDLDFGAAVIYTTTGKGQGIVLAGQKSGWVYAFNPDDGKKVWEKRIGRGGKLGGIHWGMAINETTLFVPISDRYLASDEDLYAFDYNPGLYAVDITTGALLWSSRLEEDCQGREERKLGEGGSNCFSGFSAPISISNDLVFAGSLDGRFFAYSVKEGKRVWEFDTLREFSAVNAPAKQAHGGSIDAAGPVIIDDWVFTNSGFGGHGQLPGNVLLAFSLD